MNSGKIISPKSDGSKFNFGTVPNNSQKIIEKINLPKSAFPKKVKFSEKSNKKPKMTERYFLKKEKENNVKIEKRPFSE